MSESPTGTTIRLPRITLLPDWSQSVNWALMIGSWSIRASIWAGPKIGRVGREAVDAGRRRSSGRRSGPRSRRSCSAGRRDHRLEEQELGSASPGIRMIT